MAKPQADESYSTGLDVRPLISPDAAAANRAAYMESMRRQNPGQYTTLANGQSVQVRGAMVHKYAGADEAAMLGRPEEMLKNPKPPWGPEMPRYVWRVRVEISKDMNRDRETVRDWNAGRIQYVETKDIDPMCPFAVHEEFPAPGGSNVYVTYKSLILCEIMHGQVSYDKYKTWSDFALTKVANLPQYVASERTDGPTFIPEMTELGVKVKTHEPGSIR